MSEPRTPAVYDLTDDGLYEKVREKLKSIPKEQWPDPDFYDDMLVSAKLRSMELGEDEANRAAALHSSRTETK